MLKSIAEHREAAVNFIFENMVTLRSQNQTIFYLLML